MTMRSVIRQKSLFRLASKLVMVDFSSGLDVKFPKVQPLNQPFINQQFHIDTLRGSGRQKLSVV